MLKDAPTLIEKLTAPTRPYPGGILHRRSFIWISYRCSGRIGCAGSRLYYLQQQAKQEMVGVRADTLATYGAVSQQTAEEMAKGGCQSANTNLSVSVTGIAGPWAVQMKSLWAGLDICISQRWCSTNRTSLVQRK